MESRLEVHTRMMVKPFPFEISYVYRCFHFFHTFYKLSLYSFGLYHASHNSGRFLLFIKRSKNLNNNLDGCCLMI